MKFKIQFEGDYFEEMELVREIVNLPKIILAIQNAEEIIRARLKYDTEGITDREIETLELIRSALFVECLQ